MNEPVILVPLDGTEHALVALPVAKVFSEIGEATLRIVHVAERKLPPAELVERLGLEPAQLRGSTLDIETGEPAAAILHEAGQMDACLIVMCTHTAPASPGRAVGDTALGVLRGTPCPVVLVQPERGLRDWRLHRILLPHDGTPTTSAAMRPAAKLARRADADLLVLHVAAPGAAPVERGSLTTPAYLDQPQHEWPAWAGEFVRRLTGVCPLETMGVRLLLAHGSPAAEILRVATRESIDLIVLAWRGEWGAERAATLKAVVREAPCPAMVVRVTGC